MEEHHRTLLMALDQVSEGTVILDRERRILAVNRAAGTLLELNEEGVKPESFEKIVHFKRARDRDRFVRSLEQAASLELDTDLVLRDDRSLPCSIRLASLKAPGGEPSGFAVTIRDLTAKMEMERRLGQMEKLNVLGSLVAGLAHELNNPLASVIGFAQLLQNSRKNGSLSEEMAVIHSHAVRCKKIVDQLLDFAREHAPEKKPVDVNGVIRSTFGLFQGHLKRDRIQIRMNLDPRLPLVRADESQVQQVMVNLIINARYELNRLGTPGTITVTTGHDDEGITIRMEDSGPGIPEDLLEKIFEPFFTTKPAGEGTGLGLSLVRGIVEGHGGTIDARNLPSIGAEFLIHLPQSAGQSL